MTMILDALWSVIKRVGIGKIILILVLVVVVIAAINWQRIATFGIIMVLPADQRPATINFEEEKVTPEEFELIVKRLKEKYEMDEAQSNLYQIIYFDEETGRNRIAPMNHIERFREAGIYEYEGPDTCLKCHDDMTYIDEHGKSHTVDLMDQLTVSSHYTFSTNKAFSTYGFNGEKVEGLYMGKIDRACPIPGSFSFTGWALLVEGKDGQTYSEGCGQCHIGGQYAPPAGTMMPGYKATDKERDAIDCLICHSLEYDMNKRTVVEEEGRFRWQQDRSMVAAMTITKPTSETCSRCHSHNMGGDSGAYNVAMMNAGYENPRMPHVGAKRGTPYTIHKTLGTETTTGGIFKGEDFEDVHAAIGMNCTECHKPQGHLIPRGRKGVDVVANDLPNVEVSCEMCHTLAPHTENKITRAYLNGHTDRIGCETCHITRLHPDNLMVRDFSKPHFDEETGLYHPTDILSGNLEEAITYRWYNGNGTFLAGALGDNPEGGDRYYAFETTHPWSEFEDLDFEEYYNNKIRPVASEGQSKIYPFKRFNGRMHVDLSNIGPFGGMFLPYDLETYFETGDAEEAYKVATNKPMIKMMYGKMFDIYMMDAFMGYMNIDGWNYPLDYDKVETRFIPQDATLMINHGITREGLDCRRCHDANGIMDFAEMGYSKERAKDLTYLKELEYIDYALMMTENGYKYAEPMEAADETETTTDPQ